MCFHSENTPESFQKHGFCTRNPVCDIVKLKMFAPAAHLDKEQVQFLFRVNMLHSSEVPVCDLSCWLNSRTVSIAAYDGLGAADAKNNTHICRNKDFQGKNSQNYIPV